MEAKNITLSKCLNCTESNISGKRKSHKAVFHCSCGSKYKILFVKNQVISACALLGKKFIKNMDGNLVNGRVTLSYVSRNTFYEDRESKDGDL